MNFQLLQTWTTNYCADTVEWCPIVPYQHYFVCGTYELQNPDPIPATEKSIQVRLGQVHLFSVADLAKLCLHCTVDVSGVLDCKWYPNLIHEKILLVTANADGRLIIWSLEDGEASQTVLSKISQFRINNENVLSLSVDWSAYHCEVNICVSDSAGYVSILRLDDKFELTVLHKLKIHDYEVWTATFDYKNISLIFTGGDDCLLKLTDLRNGKKVAQLHEHTSGVTSVRFNHLQDFIFASGSYDETVKLWDTRKLSGSLSTCEVGGGIWRIKWDPYTAKDIILAGMYSGFFWLTYKHENYSLTHRSCFKEHTSIAYGADICHLPSEEVVRKYLSSIDHDQQQRDHVKLLVTCSFYDKKLCLSAF